MEKPMSKNVRHYGAGVLLVNGDQLVDYFDAKVWEEVDIGLSCYDILGNFHELPRQVSVHCNLIVSLEDVVRLGCARSIDFRGMTCVIESMPPAKYLSDYVTLTCRLFKG
jgi:hypothetical protein